MQQQASNFLGLEVFQLRHEEQSVHEGAHKNASRLISLGR